MISFFYKFQSGFRPGDSTIMQLVHEIYEALEEGSEMGISKTLDRVASRCDSQGKKHWS